MVEERNHLFLSGAPEDAVFVGWLARRLTAEGYLVWSERLNLLGGESYPDDVDDAIKNRAFRTLGLYSRSCLNNPEIIRQRTLALLVGKERKEDFLIPLSVDGVTGRELDSATASLQFVLFHENWAVGLHQLLKKLDSIGTPRPLLDGRKIATQSSLGEDVLSGVIEQVYSNCFLVETIPEAILRFRATTEIPAQELDELAFSWAFRRSKPGFFLSFHQPPPPFLAKYHLEPAGGASWPHLKEVDGIRSRDIVSELIKKSLLVLCHRKGLKYCSDSDLFYFPSNLVEGDRLKYTKPDGSKTFVNAAGQRTFWRPTVSEPYRYFLAPEFNIARNIFSGFTVLIRMRVRLSDLNDVTLPARTRNSRRKHLCKDWWNDDWLHRTLAVAQFLAQEGKFTIGELEKEKVIVNAAPVQMQAPDGINEAAIDKLSFDREALVVDEEEDSESEANNI